MGRRWLLAGLAWLVTAALTTAVAIGAVNSLRQGILGPADELLSESEVSAQPPRATAGPPSPAPSTAASTPATVPPSAPPSTDTRALPTGGGTIVASCAGGQATLVSWTPRTGYEADHVVRGPARVASPRFKPHSGGGAVRAQVTCAAGVPALSFAGDD
jgi:hypothetical protein